MQIPAIFLPAGSDLPDLSPRPDSPELAAFAGALNVSCAEIRDRVETAGELRARLANLAGLATAAADACVADPIVFDDAASLAAVRAAFDRDRPGRYTPDDLVNSKIYDTFFHVRRIPQLSAAQFELQALRVASALLGDLGDSMLDRDEIAALLDALAGVLRTFGVTPVPQPGPSVPPQDPGTVHDDPDGARMWYRWVTGHHTFAVFAIFARAALLDTKRAIGLGDGDGIARGLRAAALFLRGTAAAMWYTADFPIKFYLEKMRPAMEASGARGGFSGTQNADFERYKFVREQCVESLFEAYGERASQWPKDVLAALLAFHETEVQAAEHHVLVAASKVQLDQSLAQKTAQPGGAESAVDALRQIVDAAIADISDRFVAESERDVRACAASDVPAERPLAVNVEGLSLVICRADGAFWACAGTCTHAGADLADGHMAAGELVCPLHGGKFDPKTGQPTHRPATEPLRTYPVIARDGDLFIRLT